MSKCKVEIDVKRTKLVAIKEYEKILARKEFVKFIEESILFLVTTFQFIFGVYILSCKNGWVAIEKCKVITGVGTDSLLILLLCYPAPFLLYAVYALVRWWLRDK